MAKAPTCALSAPRPPVLSSWRRPPCALGRRVLLCAVGREMRRGERQKAVFVCVRGVCMRRVRACTSEGETQRSAEQKKETPPPP